MSSININSSDSDDDAPVHPRFEDDFQLNVPNKKQLVKGPISETLNSKEPISKKPSSSGKTTGLDDVSEDSESDDTSGHKLNVPDNTRRLSKETSSGKTIGLSSTNVPVSKDVSQAHPPHGSDNLARTRLLASLVLALTLMTCATLPVLDDDEVINGDGMRKRTEETDGIEPDLVFARDGVYTSGTNHMVEPKYDEIECGSFWDSLLSDEDYTERCSHNGNNRRLEGEYPGSEDVLELGPVSEDVLKGHSRTKEAQRKRVIIEGLEVPKT